MRSTVCRLSLSLSLCVAGCGGKLDDEPVGRGDASASDPAPVSDARSDGTASPPDCPSTPPLRGGSCEGARSCAYADPSCGGVLRATCVDGRWSIGDCGEFCPQPSVTVGAPCTGRQTCLYWSGDLCAPCQCLDGRWSCEPPGACATPRAACADGVACGRAGDGCTEGKCLSICRCGFDLTYHCYAHPC